MAERRADYWNFGGIFRPVFIVAKPAQNIDRVAIDAKGDGHFMADCYLNRAVKGAKVKTEILDEKGKVVASNVTDARNSDEAHVDFRMQQARRSTENVRSSASAPSNTVPAMAFTSMVRKSSSKV